MKLYEFQQEVLDEAKPFNKCAFYYDMGLGKTFIGSEKAISLKKNILVICQKSKVNDWIEHFESNYHMPYADLTIKEGLKNFINYKGYPNCIGVINYELAWRRPELLKLRDYTLMLDESSLIQNENCKQSKFITEKLQPTNLILLSGTPVSGKYEALWSQCHLLDWLISKKLFLRQYMVYETDQDGYPRIVGYKNVERLKRKLREHGAFFKKTEEVIDLPEQTFINVKVPESKEYKKFMKDSIITVEDTQLVGDTTLIKMLYARMLCSTYNKAKMEAFKDLVNSTSDRLIVFYNFTEELNRMIAAVEDTGIPISIVNGKTKDLTAYEQYENSITFIQYQAGAYGLNLQKANKIIYFSPTLSTEQFEQSKKRTHRIGQEQICFYYQLKSGIEYRIYDVLAMRKDYTDDLFKEDLKNE